MPILGGLIENVQRLVEAGVSRALESMKAPASAEASIRRSLLRARLAARLTAGGDGPAPEAWPSSWPGTRAGRQPSEGTRGPGGCGSIGRLYNGFVAKCSQAGAGGKGGAR